MTKQAALICGNDEYLVTAHARESVDAVCPIDEQALGLEMVDGKASTIDEAVDAIDGVLAALRTIGLFGGKKVVWLRDATFLKHAVIMKNAKVKELLASLAADLKGGLSGEQYLLISGPGIDRRSAFYKGIKDVVDWHEYDLPERDYEVRPIALQRATKRLREAAFSMDAGCVDRLVDRVGFDTRQLFNELDKLMLYKGSERQISIADVDAIVSATGEAVIWDFTDAVAERKLGDALRVFRRLLFQKESAVRMVISMESLFSDLLHFREYADAGWVRLEGRRIHWTENPQADAFFKQLHSDPRKMHWFRASKILSQAMLHSVKRLDACRRLTLETHETMISSGSVPHELMMETLLARVCGRRQKRVS